MTTIPKIRPRRSVLYMPGINRRAMEKARTLNADALILDLEDAVAPARKEEARDLVCAEVRTGGFGNRELIIRINGEGTPWFKEDMAAVVEVQPDAILVPKIEDADMARRCLASLSALGANLPLWAMIETPSGITFVDDIAATDGVEVLVMGTSDLAKELRVEPTPDRQQLQYALSRTVVAARRHGLDVLDGVSLILDDIEAFHAQCQQGRSLGFDGKTLIHPSQVEPSNRVFGPSTEQIEEARRVLSVWQEAESQGRGVAVMDGRMIENLHAHQAARVVAFADALAEHHMKSEVGNDGK